MNRQAPMALLDDGCDLFWRRCYNSAAVFAGKLPQGHWHDGGGDGRDRGRGRGDDDDGMCHRS